VGAWEFFPLSIAFPFGKLGLLLKLVVLLVKPLPLGTCLFLLFLVLVVDYVFLEGLKPK